jgi:ankyrin repeat protein
VIDRGHEIPKLDNRYMVEILKRGETTEYKVQAWQIFIAVRLVKTILAYKTYQFSSLQAGTSIDAVNQEFHTTLHVAAKEATVEDVAALLDLGASIEGSKSCSESPLLAAAARGEAAITELLLARGADAERVNRDGKKAAGIIVRCLLELH